MKEFRNSMEQRSVPIDQTLDNAKKALVDQNKKKIVPIIKTVMFCWSQNIALRGHRDDSTNWDLGNPGNFQALLDFRIDSGDTVLQEHFVTAPGSATYTSKTIQNEIISCCGDLITEKIVQEAKECRFFSVLADEAQDSSNKEQMPLVIRFVDRNKEIREEFIRFIHCTSGISGEALAREITEGVEAIDLDMRDSRGQGYDGAGNMAGRCAGAASRILLNYPRALYAHCASHRLNLSIAASCKVQMINNMMDNVRIISDFFKNSPKRQSLLESKVKEFLPASSHKTLINVCRTRWVARIDGLDRFEEMYVAVSSALSEMRDNLDGSWNAETSVTALGLAAITRDFQFIIALVIARNCLDYSRPATVKLQESQADMAKMFTEISLLTDMIADVRKHLAKYHSSWYETACDIAEMVSADITKPRLCGRQTNRDNPTTDSVEQYYRVSISAPFLDHLINELKTRFSSDNCVAAKGFSIIPKIMRSEITGGTSWRNNIAQFCEMFKDDLPNLKSLPAELDLWEKYWSSKNLDELPKRISDTLPEADTLTFPNILTILKLLAVLPVTPCGCERSISVLRRLKTYLRSTMVQDRLNGLALLHVHRKIELKPEDVFDRFAMNHPRPFEHFNILKSD